MEPIHLKKKMCNTNEHASTQRFNMYSIYKKKRVARLSSENFYPSEKDKGINKEILFDKEYYME